MFKKYAKYKIDSEGNLLIRRPTGLYVNQICKYAESKFCGDNCPFFDGPEWTVDDNGDEIAVLKLCSITMSLDRSNIIDKRCIQN